MLEIIKSARHSKITGDFAENLVLYFLSKHGFECVKADYTGIDIIAKKPDSMEVMGISVKGRSKYEGKEGGGLYIPNDQFEKVDEACKFFRCSPYFAIVVDEADSIQVFIIPKSHLLELSPMRKRVSNWKMTKKWLEKYEGNKNIIHVKFKYEILNWWTK